PQTGPYRTRVELLCRLLVTDQRAIVVLPAGLPIHGVTAEERHVHAACNCGLDIRTLSTRPVLVVCGRGENLVLFDEAASHLGIASGEVTDVVPVRFHPPDHRILRTEDPHVAVSDVAVDERPVVTDLGSTGFAAAATLVKAEAAVVVVGLPRRIRGLVQDVRR